MFVWFLFKSRLELGQGKATKMIKCRTWCTRTGWKNLICWAFPEQKVSGASYCCLELPDGKGTERAEPDFSDIKVMQQEAAKEIPTGYNRTQEGWCGKVSAEVILPCSPAQSGSPRAGCPEPYWGSFWISLEMETLQSLQETCSSFPPQVIAA